MQSSKVLLGVVASVVGGAAVWAQDAEPTNQIHYPQSEELTGLVAAAELAVEEERWGDAAELYRSALDGDGQRGVGYQIAPLEGGDRRLGGPRRFVGVTQAAQEGLHALPLEGRAAFRERFDHRARAAFQRARRAGDPYRALARVYELYPIATIAPQVLGAMAELALEEGRLEMASVSLRGLLERHLEELADPGEVRAKLVLCAVGRGDVGEVQTELGLLREVGGVGEDGGVTWGAQVVDEGELVAEALRVSALRDGRTRGGNPAVHQPRGDSANRASTEVVLDVGAPRFGPVVFGESRDAERRPRQFTRPVAGGGTPRHLPVVEDGLVFAVSADRVQAYDLRTGEEARRIAQLGRPYEDPNPKVQFSGAVEQGVLVVPQTERVLRDQQYRGIPIKVTIPIRKLAGFDVSTWRWCWNHGQLLEGTDMEGWSFPSPPVTSEGVVYTSGFSIEGFVNCYVAAFDARTGEPLWSTWIASGQVEQTMFGEQATEPLCVPVAVRDGVVFHSTSFGSVAAMDAVTGRLLWVSEYEQIEVNAPRGYYADHRQIVWENNAPVVESGVVVVAPMDSPSYYGFDARTGERHWSEPQQEGSGSPALRYVLGASDGRVVLGGGHQVVCRDVRQGKLVWTPVNLRGAQVAGRGFIAGGSDPEYPRLVCVPTEGGRVGRGQAPQRLEVFDLATGKPVASAGVAAAGNVAVAGEFVVVSGEGTVAVHRNGASERDGRFR